MFPHVFPCTLTLPQIDRVRYHLWGGQSAPLNQTVVFLNIFWVDL